MMAEKILNSSDNRVIADFISLEFNCAVEEKDVALFKSSQLPEEFDIENRRIQYYGGLIHNTRHV
uniref:Uncharacterized protein n=1 Tax=viral metagenome TaxID=1070528 RepID=A0A6M3JZZ0_9ZZZZ